MMSRVSIIIPVYNASQYIDQCICALYKQTYTNWEAIFINDGSSDKSLEILQKYSSEDRRVKIYSQFNQGAAKAREYGYSKAVGEYVTFLDVDDTMTSDALEKMVNAFTADVDIVVSSFQIVKNGKIIGRKKIQAKEYIAIDYLKKVFCGQYGWELCAKMYRKRLLECPIKTPSNIRIGEDAAVFIQLVCRARKVQLISEQVYNYIQYNQSASHVKSLKYAEETLQAAFFIEDILKEESFYKDIQKDIDAMFLLFYSNSTRKGNLGRKHRFVQRIKNEHFKASAFKKIPYYKAVYVLLCYWGIDKLIYRWIRFYNL